jgi:hypothetical protein
MVLRHFAQRSWRAAAEESLFGVASNHKPTSVRAYIQEPENSELALAGKRVEPG